jgi:hypothetical protein
MRIPTFLAPLAGALTLTASLTAALTAASPDPASAGSTDPVLVIGQATASGGSPTRILDLIGSWGFDDVMQIEYPLTVVVHQGATFVRYTVGEAPVSGTFAGLADGLAEGEVPALEATGSPVATASIARLAMHEMTLALPATFAAGSVSVVLYVTPPGEGTTYLSNTATAPGVAS